MNQQLLLVLHVPQAGANHSWGSSVTNCLWWTPIPDCCDKQPFTACIISRSIVVNCWSVRCHDTCVLTDRYLDATIPHCSGCEATLPTELLRAIQLYPRIYNSSLLNSADMSHVSVAWQWLFSTLDNSAFQTTCHNMYAIVNIAGCLNILFPILNI
jgi:hypothetical protein